MPEHPKSKERNKAHWFLEYGESGEGRECTAKFWKEILKIENVIVLINSNMDQISFWSEFYGICVCFVSI